MAHNRLVGGGKNGGGGDFCKKITMGVPYRDKNFNFLSNLLPVNGSFYAFYRFEVWSSMALGWGTARTLEKWRWLSWNVILKAVFFLPPHFPLGFGDVRLERGFFLVWFTAKST